jgi:chromate transporter
MKSMVDSPPSHSGHPSFAEALRVWIRVAALSFGGPAGQIATMHRILVDEKRWISESRFLHALNYCMLLPGPEAQQLAIYIGWLLHRTLGGLVAGTLFVLPGFVSILGLSVLYAEYQSVGLVAALFYGLKPAVLAVVVEALFRIGKRALKVRTHVALAAAAFAAIFFFAVPFPVVILVAALVGLVGPRLGLELRSPKAPDGVTPAAGDEPAADRATSATRPPLRRSLAVGALWLAIWLVPVGLLLATLGGRHVLVQEALLFSKTAVVTFGGAYSVLAYIAQRAVETYGWLAPQEMLDGLGMAETTPGPLIQVVQFVGFMGAYRNPGALSPLTAAVCGSVITTWVTYAPCFMWIFLGAPYVEWLRGKRALTDALSAITAAVVGVILNLAVWFAVHTLFAQVGDVRVGPLRLLVPRWGTLDPFAALIAAAAFGALFYLRAGMLWTLAGAILLGLLRGWLLSG